MKTVLVIDDEELVIKSVEKALQRAGGYRVIICRRGDLAIELIKKEAIDLIICDIRMPNLSGVETIKQIREMREKKSEKRIPEILMTGYSDQETNAQASELEVSDYSYKPFEMKIFLSAVEKALEKNN